jgi:DNA-binding response OmpR family regulator
MMLCAAPLRTTVSFPQADPFVLLVDDHQPSLDRLKLVVETAGHRCITKSSASEALVFCDARRPTLVVTDLSMPRLDGRGLARWLKARYPATPILLLTGETLDAPTVVTLGRTFDAVLAKPLDVEPFLVLLDDLMPPSGTPTRPRA